MLDGSEYNEKIKYFLINFPDFPIIKRDIFLQVNLIEIWIINCLITCVKNMNKNIFYIITKTSQNEFRKHNYRIKSILLKYFCFARLEILLIVLSFTEIFFNDIFINVKPIRILFFNYYWKKKTDILKVKMEKYIKSFKTDIKDICYFPLTKFEENRYKYIKEKYKYVEKKIQIHKIQNVLYFECFYKGTASKINYYDLRRYIFDFIF